MAHKYQIRSKEEKVSIVRRHLNGETAMSLAREMDGSDRQVRNWTKLYLSGGEAALESKKKPGNPLSKYARRKELSYTEQLEYKVELLKRE